MVKIKKFLRSTTSSRPVLNLGSPSDEWDPLNWPAVTSATFLFSRRTEIGFRDHDNLDWIWTMPEIYNSTLSLLFIIYTPLLTTGKVMLFFCSIPLLCLVSCTSLRIIITFENHHLPARKWLPSWFIPFWVHSHLHSPSVPFFPRQSEYQCRLWLYWIMRELCSSARGTRGRIRIQPLHNYY